MFYVIEISKGDDKIKGKTILEFNTLREADSAYHKRYGTALGSNLYTDELIMLVDDKGMIKALDHFD